MVFEFCHTDLNFCASSLSFTAIPQPQMSKRKLESAFEVHGGKKPATDKKEKHKENEENTTDEQQALKQRTLIFSNRGISGQSRHLMNDLRALIPNCKKYPKLDHKATLYSINEACEVMACNNCIFFEQRTRHDLYMWLAKAPNGPSARFLVSNGDLIHLSFFSY